MDFVLQIVFFKNAITKGPTNGLNVKNASGGITRYVLGLREEIFFVKIAICKIYNNQV